MSDSHPDQQTLSNNLGRSIVQTLGRQLLVTVLGMGTVVLLARTLGPEGRGQYAVALLLATSLGKFLNLGVAPANVYFLGRNQVSIYTALVASIRMWWKLSVIGIIIATLIIWLQAKTWFPNTPTQLLFFSLLIFPTSLLQAYIISLLQGIQDFKRYNIILLITPIITLFTTIVLVLFVNQKIVGALIATIIGSFSGLFCSLMIILNYSSRFNFNYDKKYEFICLNYGFKAHLSNILAFINYKADIFMVNLYLPTSDVGIYVVAINLAEQLWILSNATSTIILPRLASLYHNELERKRLTPSIARLVFIVTLLGAIILAAFSKILVTVLFGPEFIKAVNAIFGLLPGIVIFSLSRILSNDIAARGHPELNTYASILILFINIVANVVLIPLMGILGAAIATSIAYIANALFKLFIYSYLSGNQLWEPLLIKRSDILKLSGMIKIR